MESSEQQRCAETRENWDQRQTSETIGQSSLGEKSEKRRSNRQSRVASGRALEESATERKNRGGRWSTRNRDPPGSVLPLRNLHRCAECSPLGDRHDRQSFLLQRRRSVLRHLRFSHCRYSARFAQFSVDSSERFTCDVSIESSRFISFGWGFFASASGSTWTEGSEPEYSRATYPCGFIRCFFKTTRRSGSGPPPLHG